MTSHSTEKERRAREAALDETIEETFPASDPLSSDPNPYDEEAAKRKEQKTPRDDKPGADSTNR